MYTTAAWVEAFCRELTDADREYFDAKRARAADVPQREARYGPPRRGAGSATGGAGLADQAQPDLERDLEEEGL